jgi:hypothetical protein
MSVYKKINVPYNGEKIKVERGKLVSRIILSLLLLKGTVQVRIFGRLQKESSIVLLKKLIKEIKKSPGWRYMQARKHYPSMVRIIGFLMKPLRQFRNFRLLSKVP